jgi:hypothetical protein
MSVPRLDVDSALAELQKLISSVSAANGSDIDPVLITQRLRSLERELRAESTASSRAPSVASPSPRRQSSVRSADAPVVQHLAAPSAVTRRPVVAPEPSLQAIRRSMSLIKDALPSVDVVTGAATTFSHVGSDAHRYALPTSSALVSSRELSHHSDPHHHNDMSRSSSHLNRSTVDVSFAQQYAGDDSQRLRFVIDAVSNQLQKERRWRRQLQRDVVPALLDRIEHMENDTARLRQQLAASQHEVLAIRMQHTMSSGQSDLSNKVDACLERVSQLLEAVSHDR